jgi:hypothetical protein
LRLLAESSEKSTGTRIFRTALMKIPSFGALETIIPAPLE